MSGFHTTTNLLSIPNPVHPSTGLRATGVWNAQLRILGSIALRSCDKPAYRHSGSANPMTPRFYPVKVSFAIRYSRQIALEQRENVLRIAENRLRGSRFSLQIRGARVDDKAAVHGGAAYQHAKQHAVAVSQRHFRGDDRWP